MALTLEIFIQWNKNPRTLVTITKLKKKKNYNVTDIPKNLPSLLIWLELSLFLFSDACSSATKDVVMLSNGTLNNFEIKLNTETDTPTAANSTDPT